MKSIIKKEDLFKNFQNQRWSFVKFDQEQILEIQNIIEQSIKNFDKKEIDKF